MKQKPAISNETRKLELAELGRSIGMMTMLQILYAELAATHPDPKAFLDRVSKTAERTIKDGQPNVKMSDDAALRVANYGLQAVRFVFGNIKVG